MKVTLFMAMSLNGIIARKNNEEDFLSHYGWEYFCKLVKEYGNFIIGRKTFEIVRKLYEGYGFDDFKDVTKVVLSRSRLKEKGYIHANSPKEALNKLKKLGYQKALLTGGSTVNTAFAKEKLINEVIVNIEPVVVGEGIPLFKMSKFDLKLKLKSMKRYEDSGVNMNYSVI